LPGNECVRVRMKLIGQWGWEWDGKGKRTRTRCARVEREEGASFL